jgi:outer membrane beta-barrel protein
MGVVMRLRRAITILLAVLPMVGAAQGLEGLDFSAPRKKPAAPLPPPSEDEELPPLPEAKPAPPARAEAKEAEKKEGGQADLLALPEGDVALGDRVKAVQRKGFIKRHRFEVAPLFAATVNDAFYQKIGGGLRLAYHLGDTFAVAARFTAYDLQASLGPLDIKLRPLRTDNIREGQIAFQSMLLSSQPSRQTMLEGIWSPIYGKAAWLDSRIIHFDLYLTAGVGLVWSSTSFGSVGKPGLGPHVAADVGGGLRFYPLEWLALEAGLLLTVYPDQPVESVPGTVQKILAANIGVSFFLPPSFEYFYP